MQSYVSSPSRRGFRYSDVADQRGCRTQQASPTCVVAARSACHLPRRLQCGTTWHLAVQPAASTARLMCHLHGNIPMLNTCSKASMASKTSKASLRPKPRASYAFRVSYSTIPSFYGGFHLACICNVQASYSSNHMFPIATTRVGAQLYQ
jgi:hypothetical protein